MIHVSVLLVEDREASSITSVSFHLAELKREECSRRADTPGG